MASAHELLAYAMAEQHLSSATDLYTEIKVLRQKYGAADLYVPCYQLVICVDGEGHFNGNQGDVYGEPVCRQQERDAAFNAQAMQQGIVVLRLHHEDRMYWHRHLHRAFERCKAKPGQGAVLYSNAYVCDDVDHNVPCSQ